MRAETINIKEASALNALRVLGQTPDVQRRVSDGERRVRRAGSAAVPAAGHRHRGGTVRGLCRALLLLLLCRAEGTQARSVSSIRMAVFADIGVQATLKLLSKSQLYVHSRHIACLFVYAQDLRNKL